MALPEGSEDISMEDSVEISLRGLVKVLEPADMAVVTAVRMAARAIDAMIQEDPIGGRIKSLQYHYMVTGGLEKLGGSVAARKKLGQKPEEKSKSGLAAVRGIRDQSSSGKGGTARGAGTGKRAATRKAG